MKESMSTPEYQNFPYKDTSAMNRRSFLQAVGAAALTVGSKEVVAGSPDKTKQMESGFERSDDLSGYVTFPDGNTLSIEVSINRSKVGKDGKPEVKVLIGGVEKTVISYIEHGKTKKGVMLGDPRDIDSIETIAFNGEKKTYTANTRGGKKVILPIQSTKST